MIVYVKAEIKKDDITTYYSCSLKALSLSHGMKKLESYIAKALNVWPDSMESSTRQPYMGLTRCYPLVSVNNKNIMQGLLCIERYNNNTHKLINTMLSPIDFIHKAIA